jgi:hypothetical protein
MVLGAMELVSMVFSKVVLGAQVRRCEGARCNMGKMAHWCAMRRRSVRWCASALVLGAIVLGARIRRCDGA